EISRLLLEAHLADLVDFGKRTFDAVLSNTAIARTSLPGPNSPLDQRMAFFSICARVTVVGGDAVDANERKSLKSLQLRLALTPADLSNVASYLAMPLKECVEKIPQPHRPQ